MLMIDLPHAFFSADGEKSRVWHKKGSKSRDAQGVPK